MTFPPDELDGLPLDQDQRAALCRSRDLVLARADDADEDSACAAAVAAFRARHEPATARWQRRLRYRLTGGREIDLTRRPGRP